MEDLEDPEKALAYANSLGLEFEGTIGYGKLLTELF